MVSTYNLGLRHRCFDLVLGVMEAAPCGGREGSPSEDLPAEGRQLYTSLHKLINGQGLPVPPPTKFSPVVGW